ncbi:MAG: hypothetical protein JNK15_07745 [Planctomycetes bacterium]|nr:hypothetical protein [Planctomycetota bacterium]
MRSVSPLVVVALATVPLLAQAPRTPVVTAADLPLQHGTRWTYLETPPALSAQPNRARKPVVVVAEGTAWLPDGTSVTQLRTERDGASPTFAWLAIADGALRQLLPRDATRRASFDATSPGMTWLPANLQPGATWQWTGGHDLLADTGGAMFRHEATCDRVAAEIETPAGKFQATRVLVKSTLDHAPAVERELWFAAGVGLVRERHRDGTREWDRELQKFEPAPDDVPRLRTRMAADLLRQKTAWTNPPAVRWHEGGAESLHLPGRIAVAEGDAGSQLYYVAAGPDGIAPFGAHRGDDMIAAARLAFGSETAVPPESVPVRDLALLLARAEADRRGMLRVREVPLTLTPKQPQSTHSHRRAAVQVQGGARDGTVKNVAVFLTIRKFSEVQIATDEP